MGRHCILCDKNENKAVKERSTVCSVVCMVVSFGVDRHVETTLVY